VTNDYVVRFECWLFQILKASKPLPRPKDKVVVRIRLDGSLSILWKGKTLLAEEIQIAKKGQSDFHAARGGRTFLLPLDMIQCDGLTAYMLCDSLS
jgi:hypothetical protein